MREKQITVTFGVIAYNEHRYLPDLLGDLLNQTYNKEFIEVILVDGGSTDDTYEIMANFQNNHRNEYRKIMVLDNPKRIQPAGWNVVIRNSTADLLLRIDAHARLPEDFIESNIECINSGEFICGGPRENIIDEDTSWKQMLLTAEQSMFGSGIASYRKETKTKKYVKSLFHGAYRKEVIEKVGLFNENLIRTEDNEYHYRILKGGYQICYDPHIHSYYQTRSSLKGMLKQKFQNGFWIGKTLFVCGGCVSVFHLIPFAFVMAIFGTGLLGKCEIFWPAMLLWIIYAIANLSMTVLAVINNKKKSPMLMLLPIIFVLLHIGYGLGTGIGFFTGIIEILCRRNKYSKSVE